MIQRQTIKKRERWLRFGKILLVFIVFHLWQVDSYAIEVVTGKDTTVLPLEKFIVLACEHDTVFQEILIDELYLTYYKDLTLPARDIILSVKGQYDFVFHPVDGHEKSGIVSLGKLFPYTGTTVSADYTASSSINDQERKSSFTFSVSQPIARNAFGRANRMLKKIRGLEIDLAKHQIVEAYEDYLYAVIALYFKWYSAYENMKTAESSYNFNERLLKNIRQKMTYDVARRVDVNKIHLQVMEKEENLISLKNNYDQALNYVFQATLYEKAETLIPEFPSFQQKTKDSFDEEYSMFKASSRTYQMLTLLEKKGILEVEKTADDLLPSANLEMGYIEEGSGYDIQNKENRAFAGFAFEFPFPGQKEKARNEYAKIDLEKIKLTSSNKKVQLKTDLKNLHMQIERQNGLVDIAQKKISVSEAIVKDETKNYSHGRIALNDLIQAINTLEENKFKLVYHKITLNNLMLEWLRLTDKLIERKTIDTLSGDKK